MRLPLWKGPESKQLRRSGFETRQTCIPADQSCQHTHYVILRQDLPKGVLVAQCIHAAGESSSGDLPGQTFAVALAARDQVHLEQLEQRLIEHHIPHRAIREPDAPWDNALMAIGIFPVSDRALVKPITGSLALLK